MELHHFFNTYQQSANSDINKKYFEIKKRYYFIFSEKFIITITFLLMLILNKIRCNQIVFKSYISKIKCNIHLNRERFKDHNIVLSTNHVYY